MKNRRKVLNRLLCGLTVCCMILQLVVIPPISVNAEEYTSLNPIFNPDYAALIARSDLTYTGMITQGPQGMPVANGRFGGPVWQKDSQTLAMQLNHTDAFMYNDASAVSESKGGALGQVYVDFGGAVFEDSMTQRLSLYDGKLNAHSSMVDINVISYDDSDIVAIQINDNRSTPQPISIDLKMLRDPTVIRGAHSSISTFDTSTPEVVALKQVFYEKCSTGISVNDFYCSTAVAVKTSGRTSTITQIDQQTKRLTVPAHQGTFTIIIGGDASMDETVNVQSNAIAGASTNLSFNAMYASNQNWWSKFWSKSYVYIPSQKDFEKRRNYYLYLAAISNRGDYPSKYNGGIWIAEGDRRDWGNYYWNWNQDSLYQSLNAANHSELMDPFYNLRESCKEQYETAAKQLWNCEGYFVPEASGVLGYETLPDDVATGLAAYYAGYAARSEAVTNLGYSRNAYLVPWNWVIGWGSDCSTSWVTHTMVATQETAEHYWMRYCYTKDINWLRDHAYQFIKGAAEFYRTYYGFQKESDGKYHFNRTNLHEHIWGGKDVIDDLSLARGTFAAAIKAAEILGVDQNLRTEWQERLDNLADYPLSTDTGAIGYAAEHSNGTVVWAQGLQPANITRDLNGSESPQFKMLEKYDVLNMETRDQGLDDGDWQMALNTYFATPGYTNQYLNQKEDKNGSSRFLEDVAKLGRADDLAIMFPAQYKAFTDTPNWLHDEGDYYSAEGHGTWAAAIQLALNQSIAPLPGENPVIRLFPAWPEAWDAKYKLAAQDGFIVSSSMEAGEIQYAEIESQIGGTCRIRNPWNANVIVYRNGVMSETITAGKNDLLSFSTSTNDRIILVKQGTTPDQFRTSELEIVDYATVNDTETNMKYNGNWQSSTSRTANYRSDIHYTETNGDSFEYMFYGAGVDVISDLGSSMGEIDVYIDGSLADTVDCYSSDTENQKIVYSNMSLTYAAHTIKLVKKNGSQMVVDALNVWKTPNGDSIPVEIINDSQDGITYRGTSWTYQGNRWGEDDLNKDAHVTTNNGDYVEFSFIGSGIGYITEKYTDLGDVAIYIDDVLQDTVSCYNSPDRKCQQIVYSNTNMTYGQHTIKVVKVSGEYMLADGFKVWKNIPSRVVNDNDADIIYTGSNWAYQGNRSAEDDYNKDAHVTTNNGDYIKYTFTGTGIGFMTEKYTDLGDVTIYIDDVLQDTVSCYNSPDRKCQHIVYSNTNLTYGQHTIKVVKVSGEYMLADGFKVW